MTQNVRKTHGKQNSENFQATDLLRPFDFTHETLILASDRQQYAYPRKYPTPACLYVGI